MPYLQTWIEPDIAIKHNGITIYHAYKEDDYEEELTYWFDPFGDEE